MSELILTRTDEHVGVVTLNRPEVLNALSVALMDQLIAAFEAYDRDANIYVIVLAGGASPVATILGPSGIVSKPPKLSRTL